MKNLEPQIPESQDLYFTHCRITCYRYHFQKTFENRQGYWYSDTKYNLPPDATDADIVDVLQKTRLQLYYGCHRYDPASAKPETWIRSTRYLYGISPKLDEIKKRRKQVSTDEDAPSSDESGQDSKELNAVALQRDQKIASEEARKLRLARLVGAALAHLPAAEAELMTLHHLEGYTHAEIAEKKGLSEASVAANFSRLCHPWTRQIVDYLEFAQDADKKVAAWIRKALADDKQAVSLLDENPRGLNDDERRKAIKIMREWVLLYPMGWFSIRSFRVGQSADVGELVTRIAPRLQDLATNYIDLRFPRRTQQLSGEPVPVPVVNAQFLLEAIFLRNLSFTSAFDASSQTRVMIASEKGLLHDTMLRFTCRCLHTPLLNA